MIKNAASTQKIPLRSILGQGIPEDAVNLLNKLLIFNPNKRLTAEEALEHGYVSKFHDPNQEIILCSNVVIPFNDDVRLSVDDYRNKLYELMTNHRVSSRTKPKLQTSEVNPRNGRSAEKNIKNHTKIHEKIQCESKMSLQKPVLNKLDFKPGSRHKNVILPTTNLRKSNGLDCRTQVRNNSDVPKKAPIKLATCCMYSQSYGVITQNALMELRAAGLR